MQVLHAPHRFASAESGMAVEAARLVRAIGSEQLHEQDRVLATRAFQLAGRHLPAVFLPRSRLEHRLLQAMRTEHFDRAWERVGETRLDESVVDELHGRLLPALSVSR